MTENNVTNANLKLTLAQRAALADCLKRSDGRVVLHSKMSLVTRLRICEALQEIGLVEPIMGQPDPWPKTGEVCMSFIITELGRKVAGLPDAPKGANSAEPDQAELSEASSDLAGTSDVSSALKANNSPLAANSVNHALPKHLIKQSSKLTDVVELLARTNGASIAELISATNWLPHTARAALTGLRKRGFRLVRSAEETRGTIYKLIGQETNLSEMA